jgi:hypothetical protein
MNEFRLAIPADEPELRRLSSLPIPGQWLDLSYQRNPDFFQGLSHADDQVLLGRYKGQALAAMAVRSLPRLFVAGQPTTVGYLGSLRIDPQYQGRSLLFEGFRLLKNLHEDGQTQEYLATVVEGNRIAEQLLVHKARPSWPRFHPAGELLTLALETQSGSAPTPISPQRAAEFLQAHGPSRPFFPCHALQRPGERQTWVEHEGVLGAVRDLSVCRQTVVDRYRGPLRWLLPFYNLGARLRGGVGLPPVGGQVRGGFLGYWCSDGFRPQAFGHWLRGCLKTARAAGLQWLYLGLMNDDPYLPVAQTFRHRLYRSQLYRVRYQGLPAPLKTSPAYVELAWL